MGKECQGDAKKRRRKDYGCEDCFEQHECQEKISAKYINEGLAFLEANREEREKAEARSKDAGEALVTGMLSPNTTLQQWVKKQAKAAVLLWEALTQSTPTLPHSTADMISLHTAIMAKVDVNWLADQDDCRPSVLPETQFAAPHGYMVSRFPAKPAKDSTGDSITPIGDSTCGEGK